MISLFALCCRCLFLPVFVCFFSCYCFDFSRSLLFLLLPSALSLLAVPVPAFFALPVLLLIFKLKGVLLESNRNTAQFCCGVE